VLVSQITLEVVLNTSIHMIGENSLEGDFYAYPIKPMNSLTMKFVDCETRICGTPLIKGIA